MDVLKNNISSRLRERYQFNFTLDMIYYVAVKVFYGFFPHKYIYNMVHTYMNMFGKNPKLKNSVRPPLEQCDHQEIDT